MNEWVALAHALEVISHRDSQYSKESQGKCPGDWEPKQGPFVCPGGKHERNLMSPHCLRLAPTEEAAKFPIPQVDRNDPEGRKKCRG